VLDGRRSEFRRRRHGAPAVDVPADRFVVAIQNHDQVGNRAQGERLGALVDPERRRLAAALLLCGPYVPLLFMGEEYGEPHPFQYFVSHGDPALVEAVRQGRRREFAGFGWQQAVPDPQAEATFERSVLQWDLRDRPGHAELLALYRDLLAWRQTEPLLEPGVADLSVWYDDERDVIGLGYEAGAEDRLLVWFNCAESGAVLDVDREARAPGVTLVLATDRTRYGGSGRTRLRAASGSRRLHLAPLTAAVLRLEESDR
jgi:maltooligosyltrehalose trehalohydrolase